MIYDNDSTHIPGQLYLCSTPIGNLEDITLRVLRILKEVDIIAAEDTRHTKKLLTHYDIHTPVTSYHEHNEREKGLKLISEIQYGKNVALVSDAGTPGVSDPGYELVVLAIKEGIKVVPCPGASASLAALAASGLPTDRFVFEGFLPRSGKDRDKALKRVLSEERTVIFYESPYRIIKTLQELLDYGGDRNVVVTRELTKVYEQFIRGTVSDALVYFETKKPKGEFTVLIEGRREDRKIVLPDKDGISAQVEELITQGIDKKSAIKQVSQTLGISKRQVYSAVLEDRK